jgi:hypothetical protein
MRERTMGIFIPEPKGPSVKGETPSTVRTNAQKRQEQQDHARAETAARQTGEIEGAIRPATPEGVVRARGW